MLALIVIHLFVSIVTGTAQIPIGPANAPAKADVYPSAQSAMAALADQIADQLSKAPAIGPVITITHSLSGPSEGQIGALTIAIQARFPKTEISIEPNHNLKPTTAPVITLSSSSGNSDFAPAATISAIISGPVNASFSVKIVNKQWVDDFATFISSQPTKNWIVGQSTETCPTIGEADNDARRSLAEQLLPMARQMFGNELPKVDDGELTGWIASRCVGPYASDKFVQRIDHPYGQTWQEWILMKNDPDVLQSMLTPLFMSNVQQHASQANGFFSMIALAVVIVLLYAFLNWITKGYFSTRLKIAAVVLLIIGAMLLFLGLFTTRVTYQTQAVEHRMQADAEQRQMLEQREAQAKTDSRPVSAQTQQ